MVAVVRSSCKKFSITINEIGWMNNESPPGKIKSIDSNYDKLDFYVYIEV